ncbi:YDG/SRA domain-containing protein [Streptomyces fulvorobeus]|uniref:Putative restriction endonuclease n=1 Tax=Streptomyces fulvorobeus TaxID=284028 RepID=A0A7Y9KTJ9_9ACTN|nr:YDG/SRA domain-containing protein [Streptomyces fulvorobeus]NYE41036.1 putative restriction endonuclease [Streptomyces fulvorobeus]
MNDILPGTHFESRKDVKDAQLHKEREAGISWGRDDEDERAADAIVLSNGYADDVDQWNEITYTGAGGQTRNSSQQTSDQSWDNYGNASLRRSRIKGNCVRVIRGSKGERAYSPGSGYRYDGLYEIVADWSETGRAGFQICRFKLRRLADERQELTSVERQVQDMLDRRGQHLTEDSADDAVSRRRTTTVERIVRDTAVVRRVKRWHNFACQVCGLSLAVGADGRSYAEGAHIHALGGPDGGPDVDSNVLCLCPNCHVQLDRGALYLTDDLRVVNRFARGGAPRSAPLRTVEQHRIEKRFIRAHRRFWGIQEQSLNS